MTAEAFRRARQALGGAQVDVARALGVALTTVSGWENGRAPVPRWVNLSAVAGQIRAFTAERRSRSREARANSTNARHEINRVNGKAFRSARQTLGLTQIDVAHALGLHKNTVLKWEQGKIRVPTNIDLLLVRERTRASAAARKERGAAARVEGLRRRWKKLPPEARSEIVSLMLKKGWAHLSKSERAERQSKLFWSWFPQADPDTQRRVMTVINRLRRPERVSGLRST